MPEETAAYVPLDTPLTPLTRTQITALLSAIAPERVKSRDGKSYLQSYDVRRALTKAFGFAGWSGEVVDTRLLYERDEVIPAGEKDGKSYPARDVVSVAYMVRYKLTIWTWLPDGNGSIRRHEVASYTEEAAGDGPNQPRYKRMGAHDFAIKTAESQAFKRAAINLGDQFGLSLYGPKWQERFVDVTLVAPVKDITPEAAAAVAKSIASEPVAAEPGIDYGEVPDDERDWIIQAEALRGDEPAVMALWSEARAKKNPPLARATLDKIKSYGDPDDGEGEA